MTGQRRRAHASVQYQLPVYSSGTLWPSLRIAAATASTSSHVGTCGLPGWQLSSRSSSQSNMHGIVMSPPTARWNAAACAAAEWVEHSYTK